MALFYSTPCTKDQNINLPAKDTEPTDNIPSMPGNCGIPGNLQGKLEENYLNKSGISLV